VRASHPLLGDEQDRADGDGDGRRERRERRQLRSKMGDGGKILKIRSGDGSIRIDR